MNTIYFHLQFHSHEKLIRESYLTLYNRYRLRVCHNNVLQGVKTLITGKHYKRDLTRSDLRSTNF